MKLADCFPDTYVVADIETSGLNHRTDHILEIATAYIYDRRVLYTEVRLVNPNYPMSDFVVPSVITDLTGITSEMVADGLAPTDAFDWFALTASNTSVYFHNGHRFDIPFLRAEAAHHQASSPANPVYLDTAVLYKAYKLDRLDELSSCLNFEVFADVILNMRVLGLKYNLLHCCDDLGVDISCIGRLHRAEADVQATCMLVEALRERIDV